MPPKQKPTFPNRNEYTRELAPEFHAKKNNPICGPKGAVPLFMGPSFSRYKKTISLISFGYKQGIPKNVDFIFDVRFLANPYYVASLKHKTGHSPDVARYVLKQPSCTEFLQQIENLITFLIHEYKKEKRSHLTMAFGCTGGKHRSVVVTEAVKKFLKHKKIPVLVVHRDETI